MNKTQTLELLIPHLERLLSPLGFKYLKSQEKFSAPSNGDKKSISINVTYWKSSDYTMLSPILGIRFTKIEKYKEKHLKQKSDPQASTLHLRNENMPNGKFWSFDSVISLEEQQDEIEEKMTKNILPHLEQLSSISEAIQMVIDRTYDNFMNEYERLILLFCFVGAYEKNEMIPQILNSFDSSRSSMNQLIPHHIELLSKLVDEFPEIDNILENQKV